MLAPSLHVPIPQMSMGEQLFAAEMHVRNMWEPTGWDSPETAFDLDQDDVDTVIASLAPQRTVLMGCLGGSADTRVRVTFLGLKPTLELSLGTPLLAQAPLLCRFVHRAPLCSAPSPAAQKRDATRTRPGSCTPCKAYRRRSARQASTTWCSEAWASQVRPGAAKPVARPRFGGYVARASRTELAK